MYAAGLTSQIWPMADVFERAKRSAVMAKIRGRGNRSTELAVVRTFRAAQITGWRRHVSFSFRVPATAGDAVTIKSKIVKVQPDFIFREARLAIFIDGCFWHCCPLHFRLPEDNRTYWEAKFRSNVARDSRAVRLLRAAGWHVLRVWEHELKDPKPLLRKVKRRLSRYNDH